MTFHLRQRTTFRRSIVGAALLLVVLTLVVPGLFATPAALPTPFHSQGEPGLSMASTDVGEIVDDGSINISSPVRSLLTDVVSNDSASGASRSYLITITATVTLVNVSAEVATEPIPQWGLPQQLPGGADSLPPLTMWSWSVVDDGVNVTRNWTATAWDQTLNGEVPWTNQTIAVRGTVSPIVTIDVNPTAKDGTTTPGAGFVVNTPGVDGGLSANETDFLSVAQSLHPAVVRFGTDIAQTSYSWNTVANQPKYNFTYFDQLVNFSRASGAKILLSLPAGTWGDGNLLPGGMPLNLSLHLLFPAGSGYFPQDAAWAAFVEGIVNHTVATHETITYWSIGNEFADTNQTVVAGYIHVFNIAEKVIHAQVSGARVGSDAMINVTFESYFATHAKGVGFLSFHYYPSLGLCDQNGSYCTPAGPPNGTTDEGLLSHPAYEFLVRDNTPSWAQTLWHNLAKKWLPVLNTETNINSVGGNSQTLGVGTDPRTQTLFGASWVSAVLIDGANQNVSALTYFTLSSGWGIPNTTTAPYGGWGFGLTSEAKNDSTIRFAPYLALQLWGESMPAGTPGLVANSTAPTVVEPYATMDGKNLSVFLVNRVNSTVSIRVDVTHGGYTLGSVSTLDRRSYKEVYEPSENATVLRTASVALTHPANGSAISIEGYGVAVARFTPPAPVKNSSGNGTGNGTGGRGGGTGSGGNGTNGIGNGTGGGGSGSGGGNSTPGGGTANGTGGHNGSGTGTGGPRGGSPVGGVGPSVSAGVAKLARIPWQVVSLGTVLIGMGVLVAAMGIAPSAAVGASRLHTPRRRGPPPKRR